MPPTNPLIDRARVHAEARNLYVLLDSIDDAGLLAGTPYQAVWRSVQKRVAELHYEEEGARLYELLEQVAAAGALERTDLGKRWRRIQDRIDPAGRFRDPAEESLAGARS